MDYDFVQFRLTQGGFGAAIFSLNQEDFSHRGRKILLSRYPVVLSEGFVGVHRHIVPLRRHHVGDKMPAEYDKAPAEEHNVPAEYDTMPADPDKLPAEDKLFLAEDKNCPAEHAPMAAPGWRRSADPTKHTGVLRAEGPGCDSLG